MAMPHVYMSTDTGAPVLTGQAGSWSSVLKACLVNGYGTKDPAGMSIAFEDVGANKLVLRNSMALGGAGSFFRNVDAAGGAQGGREATIEAFASMSDIDTGTFGTGARIVRKSSTADGTARRWIIVSDGISLWWTINPSAALFNLGGAGEAISHIAGIPPHFVAGHNTSGNEYQSALLVPAGTVMGDHNAQIQSCQFGADRTGLSGPARFALMSPIATISGAGINTNAIGSALMAGPAPTGGETYKFSPAYAASESRVRGELPGLYVPLNDVSGRDIGYTFSGLIAPDSELMVLRGMTNAGTAFHGGLCVETARPW